ncbi:Zonadhesin [Microtus ochrogaster]|uniref:Zonadhesin n=1 Tax=Microtus ochrogaster TaxID=79684 RepID=A0A8J6KWM1_MICOH|nr:Zonadhesin [Microtus ochrogaster]
MSADDGDWIRTTGPSPTGTSGPPGGYPNGEGYYLHMDASTFPRGGVARLRSPDIWEQGPLCIHFAFHMFGLSWGAQLRLMLLKGWRYHRPNVLWKYVNTQSPSWMPTMVTVPADRDIPSWLMFEGMRGNTAYLDISLDGLSIRKGTCNRICMSQMCNFDALNNLCGWSWVPTATGAKWTQKKGSSGILGVGPDDDFSSPGREHYIYFDSAMVPEVGQSARLVSPPFCAPGDVCVEFAYHMYGLGEGTTLKLLLGSPAGSSPISLWKRVGSQSTGWVNSSVTILKGHQQPMELLLEATQGTSTAFVIAVNYILISHGPCRAKIKLEGPASSLFPERCRCLPGSRMECQISQCATYTVCLLKSGKYECQPYGSATCLVYGDLHFVTFDERHISFTGTCTYILAQTCDNSTASTQERGVEGVSSLDKVFITLPETTITMTSGRQTLIGDQRVTLPVIPSNNIYVGLSGRFVELRTTFGLRVKWDGDQQLFMTVPSTYSRKLCGFCGNYDGDSSNDNQKPDGTRTQDGDELGKSWQLKEKENEEACLVHMKASFFLDNCVSDMCSFQGLQQMLCTHMSAMTAVCQDAGYAVRPWRRPQFCPLVCPQNSRYSLCAKPCPDTCHPGSALQPCPKKCVEACECEPGFVLSGFECVPRIQCGCTSLEGRYFKVQEQWFNPDCKEICTCDGNNSVRCRPWKCRAQEVCSHKNGVLGCHAQGAATCIASGDPHYLTFDGALHHFMGTCTYVLTQPCWSNAHDNNFVVSVTNEVHDGNLEVSSVKAVHVQVSDLKVSLFKGRTVMLNNQRVALPVWPLKGRVTIRLSGIFVLLYTDFGLQVRYDGKHLVEVTVPSLYAGFLCGLCGNYNNNSLDDNLRPDGKPAGNSLLLGAAWKILEASEPGCFVVGGKSSSCQENSMDDAWTKKCAILMNPIGPFSNCHEAVPPQASFSSCVYGQCGTKGDILALCRSLQAYASLCAQAGQVITWRNSTFCPLRCPPRSSYNPCANPCPATCLTLSSPRDCPTLPCVEGCECQTGHILSGTTCVPLRQCGCSDQDGSYHLLGESWYTEKTCTTVCTCSVHSNVTCSQTACEANHVCLRQNGLLRCAAEMGECHISEDSQIVSFDGHSHPIQDMCTYIMVKVCHPSMNLPFFTISAKADQHTRTKTFSVYQLYIDIFSFRVTLQKRHSVLINDMLVTLPATTQIPGVSITTEDVYTIVTIKDEVQVKFESNNFLDIKIPASSTGKVCGVCGNFNGEEEDELMTPRDELAQDEQEFMESWKDTHVDPDCQKIKEQNIQVEQQEIMNGNCRPTDFEKAQANCQTALQGPTWAQCASRVSLKPFLLGCINNFCEFRELFHALCEALQSFQDACQKQGLKPPIWRNSSFCPLECPPHSHYTNCLPSCPPSCLDPNSRCKGSGHKVPFTCKEGCICQPGYVLNNDKCVLKTHCGCKDAQGVFVPEGKNWISSSCTQNCVCIGGAIECQNFQCPSGAQCQDNEDGSSKCVKITPQCPAHSLYTNCLPPCPPSCSNLDGHCRGTNPKVPFTCKEGCLCHPGFVLDKNKCVPRTHCGCKDTQGAFIPTGKTWMSTGCTQSCACVRGAIRCRNFQCPSGTYCKDSNDGSSDCVKITLQCPAHSQYTDCLPSCLPSCLDPEGHCESARTRAPSACQEGCVCQPGFVMHDDKCMLKIECSCQDTQGAFIPVGKSWISRGCSRSCNCMGGVIRCQKFKCPSGTFCLDNEDYTSNCVETTMQCPAHSHYTNCVPSCLASCSDPEGHCEGISTKAPSTCKEGCVCEPGYVLHDGKCVLRTECGCKDAQGALIPAGKTWISRGCTQSCACMEGTIQCQNFQCPQGSYCFDSNYGNSSCTKITLQCPAHTVYTNCLPSCLASCSDPDGLCRGISHKAPSTCKEGCVCEPGYVLHDDKCMLRIHCGCKDAQGALIPSGKTWINRGCTQTCTCTGGAILCRNFQCPPGTYCKDIEDGNSKCIKITLQCPEYSLFINCLPACQPSCTDPDGRCVGSSTKGPSTCKEGCVCESGYVLNDGKCVLRNHCGCKDAQGALIPADKTWINRGCTQSCTCVGGVILCRNFQCPSGTYCKDIADGNSNCTKISGVEKDLLVILSSLTPAQKRFLRLPLVLSIRLLSLYSIALQCPDNSHYTDCLPSCPPSCLDLEGHCEGTSPKVPSTCKEGCLCNSGFVLNKGKCIPRIQCDCKDAQGALIPAGKTWTPRGCTKSCACTGGTVQCQNFQCPSETYCKDNDDGNSNCVKITLQCPAHSHFTDCLPSCQPSCFDPDGRCEGTSPKVPSCKEGCLCEPGYVLGNDKCVLRTECDCKDAQGALIPAGKTWLNEDCTESCNCMEGTVQCRTFQCPLGTDCKDSNNGSYNCVKITLQCPAHSRYTNCLPPCPPSCTDLDGHCEGTSPNVPSTCKEGCVCQPGYVLNNNKCVLQMHCDCRDARGDLIPAGKTWLSSGCSQSCTCMGGVVQCRSFNCPPGTQCQNGPGGNINCTKIITLQCPDHSYHTSCLPSCIPSCSNLNEHCEVIRLKDPSTCKEGCLCQSGFVFNRDKCVPRIECDCKDSQGAVIPAGKTWISSGCTQSCACINGAIQCQKFSCPSETHCQHSDDGSSNCASNTLKCPARSFYTSCLPSCLPTCSDPEGLCQGSSPRVPSTCKEGCICRSGYVLHDDKCVLRIHCGCKDARGNLIQTGQTWISTDCTRICACKEGLFQCQNFQCPSGTHCQQYQDGSSNCVSDTLKCPANSLYTGCLPSCLPSCSNPNGHCEGVSPKDPSTCKEGCVCRPGYLLSEDKCVPRNQCGCKELEKCTIFGDPYYHTFDGFSYRFLGRMNYYLIKTVDKLPEGMEHLVIEGRNKISPKGNPTLHEVTTNVYSYKIQLQEGLVALVNNQKVAIPYSPNDHLRVLLRAQRLFLITDFEMVVDFDGKHSAVISLPTMYRGLIQGLCGNYDKDRANDLMLPSGTLASNISVFGNSWEVNMVKALLRLPRALPEEDGGEEESDPLPSECSPEQTALLSSTQACRVVVDPQGPFAACHQIVAPEPFEQ